MSGIPNHRQLLVLDESPEYGRFLLESLGAEYRIHVVSSLLAAKAFMTDTPPDLVLLGVSGEKKELPRIQALAQVLDFRDIPVIVLSNRANHDEEVLALEMSAADYLGKSVAPRVLAHRIRNTLERKLLRSRILNSQDHLRRLIAQTEERQNLLASVFNATSDAILVLDPDMNVRHANHLALEFFGDEAGNISTPIVGLSTEDGSGLDILNIPSDQDQPLQCMLETPQGKSLRVEASLNRFSVAGQAGYSLVTVGDISHRLQLQNERGAAEAEQRRLIADLIVHKHVIDQHALVVITDLSGRIHYVNYRLCDVFGYSSDELLTKDIGLFYAGQNGEEVPANLARAIAEGQSWQGEIVFCSKDGVSHWLHATLTPWLDASGKPYRGIFIGTDVTSRKQAEQALRAASERELRLGADIRNRLLYTKPPEEVHGFSLACFTDSYLATDRNFVVFMPFNAHCFDVLIGDVEAKDIAAALLGAAAKSDYHHVVIDLIAQDQEHQIPSVEAIINALHARLTPELIKVGAVVTLALLRFDRIAQTVSCVNAAHTPVLLARTGSKNVEVRQAQDIPIGCCLAEGRYIQEVIRLEVGDAILLYSDDLSEVIQNRRAAPDEGMLVRFLAQGQMRGAPGSVMLTTIRKALKDRSGREQGYSRRGLLVQMRPVRQPKRGTVKDRRNEEYLDLTRRLDQLGLLRQRVEALCADQDDDFISAFVLAAHEAAAFIIRQSSPAMLDTPITVVLARSDTSARVELNYQGEPITPPDILHLDESVESVDDIGLFIMECAVDHVHYISRMPGIAGVVLSKSFSREMTFSVNG
jgi:PAS domain S-box-containing protein